MNFTIDDLIKILIFVKLLFDLAKEFVQDVMPEVHARLQRWREQKKTKR